MVIFDLFADPAQCAERFREVRWPQGVQCVRCHSPEVRRMEQRPDFVRRYRCRRCQHRFTDLTGTVLARSHVPLHRWFLAAHLFALNLTQAEVSRQLGVEENTAQRLGRLLRDSAFFQLLANAPALARGSG